MHTIVREPISVEVFFSSGRIIPRFFIWKQKKYNINKITYFWRSSVGIFPVLYFSVISGRSIYEISYDLKTSKWCLETAYEQ